MKPVILALDIGSSSTRAALFDSHSQPIRGTSTHKEYAISYRRDGAAEISPTTLWRALNICLDATFKHGQGKKIAAVSISSFWHGLVGLDRGWQPITPIYTWADSRSAGAARRLRERLSDKRVHARTGCRIHSSYWPAKLFWLAKTEPRLFRKVRFWVSPIDWLLHRMAGTSSTTPSIASGTGLYNRAANDWDEELCAALRISRERLLPIIPSLKAAHAMPGPFQGPIFSLGDGAASNLGSGADRSGMVAINLGTSGAVRMVVRSTEPRTDFGLFRYVLDKDRHVIGGATSNAGNLRQWTLRTLRLSPGDKEDAALFDRVAAAADYLTALPSWVAERAPTWSDQRSGLIYGLTQWTTPTEVGRVLATSVFYRLASILDLIRKEHFVKRVIVSGGMLRSPPAIRVLADALGRDVEVARDPEASLRGAALFALENLGCKTPSTRPGRVVKPDAARTREHRERRARQERLEGLMRQL